MVLRPLAHIHPNWELTWDAVRSSYEPEDDSFAAQLNRLVDDLARCPVPRRYHDNEDVLAEYVVAHLHWPIRKFGNRWVGAGYDSIIEQGASRDADQANLLAATAGRIHAAIVRGQTHFDAMEE